MCIFLIEILLTVVIKGDNIDRLIIQINRVQRRWKADRSVGIHAVRTGVSFSQNLNFDVTNREENMDALPDEFDARRKWDKCTSIPYVWNQGPCGSCWAISAASMLSDRICILTNGKSQVSLSAEQLIACCSNCSILPGCKGGDPRSALWYYYTHGLVTGGSYGSNLGCQPYSLPPCKVSPEGNLEECPDLVYETPLCNSHCTNTNYNKSFQDDIHTADNPPYQVEANEQEIKNEIYKNGPAVVIFKAHIDFIYYKSGIYQSMNNSKPIMWHSARLIGWGSENDVPYWLVVNSWGSEWGENGTFRILRGFNECSFEKHVMTIIPKIN